MGLRGSIERTLEFSPAERDAPDAATPLHCCVTRLGLGLGCQLQQLTRGAFELEPLVVVRQRAGMRGSGDGDVPEGFDGAALLGLVNGLQGRDQGLAEPLRQELVEIGLDPLGPGVLDCLQHRLGTALRIFAKDGGHLFDPAVWRAARVADANLGVLVRTPDVVIAADVVEEEEPGAERGVADFGVPDEEAACEGSRLAITAVGDLDAAVLIGEEHEHVAIAGVEGRIAFVDRDALAEDARHAPVTGDAVAETLDEGIDHVRIPDATVAGSGGGAELDAVALARDQELDVFDTAGEPQIVVEAVCDDRSGQLALAEVGRRGWRRCERAELPERPMRRRGLGPVAITDEQSLVVAIVRDQFDLSGADDLSTGWSAAKERRRFAARSG